MDNNIINIDIINELFEDEDDMSQLTYFIDLSFNTITTGISNIKISIETLDGDKLHNGSHTIKGLSTLGLCKIPIIAENMCKMSKKENINWNNIQEYCQKLENEFVKYKNWWDSYKLNI
jgi:hypothetical protein